MSGCSHRREPAGHRRALTLRRCESEDEVPGQRAPELVENKPASERSDIYSLGIIYYEMLTGQKPFDSTGIAELIGQHLKAPIPRLPDKLAEYQPLVDGMMAKNPDQRFQTADAVLDAVDRVWTQISLSSMN